MNTLTPDELTRYSRHISLKEFGLNQQVKLKQAKVLVVGAGGLGCPCLLYLSAVGIGTIGIIDFDNVDVSNLQRQILYDETLVGKNKAKAAVEKLRRLNSLVDYKSYTEKLTSSNALEILKDYDVVVDGTDNFSTRYLLNDTCVLLDKPLVYASILKFEGHVAVFNLKLKNQQNSITYRDVFPTPPDASSIQNCEEAGVIGVLPGIMGSLQANEVIKIIAGMGEPLTNKLLVFDSLTLEQTIITLVDRNARQTVKSLIDYDEFCGISQDKSKSLNVNQTSMKEVTVQELKKMMDEGADFQLIDVREPHEYDICNLGAELIPQGDVPSNTDKISKDKQVIVHCRSGARSANIVQWLEKNHGYTNLYNLKGGVLAWAREIDPSMPTY